MSVVEAEGENNGSAAQAPFMTSSGLATGATYITLLTNVRRVWMDQQQSFSALPPGRWTASMIP